MLTRHHISILQCLAFHLDDLYIKVNKHNDKDVIPPKIYECMEKISPQSGVDPFMRMMHLADLFKQVVYLNSTIVWEITIEGVYDNKKYQMHPPHAYGFRYNPYLNVWESNTLLYINKYGDKYLILDEFKSDIDTEIIRDDDEYVVSQSDNPIDIVNIIKAHYAYSPTVDLHYKEDTDTDSAQVIDFNTFIEKLKSEDVPENIKGMVVWASVTMNGNYYPVGFAYDVRSGAWYCSYTHYKYSSGNGVLKPI